MSECTDDFAAEVRAAMSKRNLGRGDVVEALRAQGVEVSTKTISNLRNGRHSTRPGTTKAVADLLGIAPPGSRSTREVTLRLDLRFNHLVEFLRFVADKSDPFNNVLLDELADQIEAGLR